MNFTVSFVLGAILTVCIRIGATPVFRNLVLTPLRIALVPPRWSASAYKFQMCHVSRRYVTGAWNNPPGTYNLENNIGPSGEPL